MSKIFLKKKISNRIAEGHPWIYTNEIGDEVGQIAAGDIVDVFSSNGSFVGKGYYNAASQIKLRLLSRKQENIDNAFFYQKIDQAWTIRKSIGFFDHCRVINGESDGLPGLIVDKYGDYLVLQTLALGIDRWKKEIVDVLMQIFQPKGIYERNDVPVRQLENLPFLKGFLSESFDPTITINYNNNLQLKIDLASGDKTGFYGYHSDNINKIAPFVKHANVLDLFCYTGLFALQAAACNANSVLGIDYNPNAISLANENVAINGYSKNCKFECRNAFDAMKQFQKDAKLWDVVILDPPSFMRSKNNEAQAKVAYKEIQLRAMKLLKPGGFLITSSSSPLLSKDAFEKIITEAAIDTKKVIKQWYSGTQSSDYPVLWTLPNTQFLKFFILQVF